MNEGHYDIHTALLHKSFQLFPPDNWKIFFDFLILLLEDNGEIFISSHELEIKLDTSKSKMLKVFDKLKKEKIITQKGGGKGEKLYLEKCLFSLNKKYINKQKQ